MSRDRAQLRWNGWGQTTHHDPALDADAVWAWLAGELGMPSLLATPARQLSDVVLPAARLAPAALKELARIVESDQVHQDSPARIHHARGRSYPDLLCLRAGDLSLAPDAVVFPQSTEQIYDILKWAELNDIAIVPYGGGTSVVGGVTPQRGHHQAVICLDLSAMDTVLDIDQMSGLARVQAGIRGPALEQALGAVGLTLGHFPQSFEYSTLGGWIAHRGAGQQSNGYGRADDWLQSALLVSPRGLLHTEAAPASAAGPRLKDLILGSEGLFGVIAEASVRVHTQPRARRMASFLFADFAGGLRAIRLAVQSGIEASMLRLSDPEETRFFRAWRAAGQRPRIGDWLIRKYLAARRLDGQTCALIALFEGPLCDEAHRDFARLVRSCGGVNVGQGPARSWLAGRFHAPYLRDPMLDHGVGVDTLETATSWTNLDRLYDAVTTALRQAITAHVPRPGARGIVMCHVSHSYPDGASLYFTFIFPRVLDAELAQWRAIKTAASKAIITHGGTISHHHGVGEDHRDYMVHEKGPLGIEVLRAVKATLDPRGILNPGKLIPD
ncbi:MAG: FAD-binding oxidoreductase [Alphaproteobacteria bacterium]|nr:FAD-binding oxidoreductase [Alphaproteobacteria bacterium]